MGSIADDGARRGQALDEAQSVSGVAADARVLVYVGADLVGDGLMKLPFVRALRAAVPAGELVWMAGQGKSAYRGELAGLVEGLLDAVVDEAGIGQSWAELLKPRPFADVEFDLVIDTQRSVKTTLAVKRLNTRAFVSGAAEFMLSDIKPPKGYVRPDSMVRQMLDLLELATGEPADPSAPLSLPEDIVALATALLPQGPTYVGLVPGAGGQHKRWPVNSFVAVARTLVQDGIVPVFILGPAEADLVEHIGAAVPSALFPLQNRVARQIGAPPALTIALCQRMAAAVANDSGGGHMAAASGVPLVSLFGPTSPAKFAPFGRQVEIIQAQAWGGEAMALIPIRDVLSAVAGLLQGRI